MLGVILLPVVVVGLGGMRFQGLLPVELVLACDAISSLVFSLVVWSLLAVSVKDGFEWSFGGVVVFGFGVFVACAMAFSAWNVAGEVFIEPSVVSGECTASDTSDGAFVSFPKHDVEQLRLSHDDVLRIVVPGSKSSFIAAPCAEPMRAVYYPRARWVVEIEPM